MGSVMTKSVLWVSSQVPHKPAVNCKSEFARPALVVFMVLNILNYIFAAKIKGTLYSLPFRFSTTDQCPLSHRSETGALMKRLIVSVTILHHGNMSA